MNKASSSASKRDQKSVRWADFLAQTLRTFGSKRQKPRCLTVHGFAKNAWLPAERYAGERYFSSGTQYQIRSRERCNPSRAPF
ncbi:hypothetical protein GRI33_06040 [Brucella sp. BO3]|nr:hypothetical protein BKD03_15560 [Brucella sp. 09RB8471]MRN79789.1 hypothetical protein [Brucella sp. 10RB9210]QGA56118.1 hypothetical protein GHC20_03040 [Brucella sp. 2280]QMV26510.1 hypothetical protein GRI33_06040 [Brucella sp. BO3]